MRKVLKRLTKAKGVPVGQKSIMIFLVIKTYLKILVVLIVTKKKRVKMALLGQMNITIFLVTQTCSKISVALITKSNYFLELPCMSIISKENFMTLKIKLKISKQEIDTVLVCMVDMQGRLMGKRFHSEAFLEMAEDETHCCNYLLATDLEMATPDGYASTSWSTGYGDYVMKPDLGTLRPVPWIEGTAICLCDVLDHNTHKPVPFSPREVLKTQISKAEDMGFSSIMATELEFFLFQGTHDEIAANGFRELKPISNYNEDYHIFQTSKEEHVMRPIRNFLRDMGIPVEGTKGEARPDKKNLISNMLCSFHSGSPYSRETWR